MRPVGMVLSDVNGSARYRARTQFGHCRPHCLRTVKRQQSQKGYKSKIWIAIGSGAAPK